MAKDALTVNIRIDGARETLKAFRGLPKDANKELRVSSQGIADNVAQAARVAAQAEGRQAALMARTVRGVRDRFPVVVAGGDRRVGRRRKPAYKLLFGSEFGSNRLKQFKPHRGRRGYWFFPLVESQQPMIAREWNKSADRILAKFRAGPGGA